MNTQANGKFLNYSMRLATRLIILILFVSVLPLDSSVFAYKRTTTHRALTQDTVELYNYFYPGLTIDEYEKNIIMEGSHSEDDAPRWLNHFYDPLNNRGLTYGSASWPTSKKWVHSQELQSEYRAGIPLDVLGIMHGGIAGLFTGSADYTWERALFDYTYGDKQRGLRGLGQVLHLIQDASVPDHTRNDPHPDLSEHMQEWNKSPYEIYADRYNTDSISVADEIIAAGFRLSHFDNIDTAFNKMAGYSNENFFSRDTIMKVYTSPWIDYTNYKELGSDGAKIYYIQTPHNQKRPLAVLQQQWDREHGNINDYILDDPKNEILSSYWQHLSREAVLNGAGVIKLFFDEVEKEKQTGRLKAMNQSAVSRGAQKVATGVAVRAQNVALGVKSAAQASTQAGQALLAKARQATDAAVSRARDVASVAAQTVRNMIPYNFGRPTEQASAGEQKLTSNLKPPQSFSELVSFPMLNTSPKTEQSANTPGNDAPKYSAVILNATETKTVFADAKVIQVQVRARNTGTAPWQNKYISLNSASSEAQIALLYHPSWLTRLRPAALDQSTVGQGGTGSFSFNIAVPAVQGTYALRLRLVRNDSGSFLRLGDDVYTLTLVVSNSAVAVQTPLALPLPLSLPVSAIGVQRDASAKNTEAGGPGPDTAESTPQSSPPTSPSPSQSIISSPATLPPGSGGGSGGTGRELEEEQAARDRQALLANPAESLLPQEATSTTPLAAPSVVFTTVHTIPDSTVVKLVWSTKDLRLSNVRTAADDGTRFAVQYSTDNGATWSDAATSTEARIMTIDFVEAPANLLFRVRSVLSETWDTKAPDSPFVVYSKDVVINEIAPWGTSEAHPGDEWIELHNTTGHPIALDGWMLESAGGLSIPLSGTIYPYNYFVLERGDGNVLGNIIEEQVYNSVALNNIGDNLFLKDASGVVIDQAEFPDEWPGLSEIIGTPTLMRQKKSVSGSLDSNWSFSTDISPFATNRQGSAVEGTPALSNKKAQRIEGPITDTVILTDDEHYVIDSNTLEIASGGKLVIGQGSFVTLKHSLFAWPQIIVRTGGTLQIRGTATRPVVFTLARDTYFGRFIPGLPMSPSIFHTDNTDLFHSPTSSILSTQDVWLGIRFDKGSVGSINGTIFRYGSFKGDQPFLSIASDEVSITNSTFDHIRSISVIEIDYSSPFVAGNTILPFPYMQNNARKIGIKIKGGSPAIQDNLIAGDLVEIYVEASSTPSIERNTIGRFQTYGISLKDSGGTVRDNVFDKESRTNQIIGGILPGDFSLDGVWAIDKQVVVPADTALTIKPGTRVFVKGIAVFNYHNILVRGALYAAGTAEQPILITHINDERLIDDPFVKTFGSGVVWGGIGFFDNAVKSLISHTTIRYGGQLLYGCVSEDDGFADFCSVVALYSSAGVSINKSDIVNGNPASPVPSGSFGSAVYVDNSTVDITASTLRAGDFGFRARGASQVLVQDTLFKNVARAFWKEDDSPDILVSGARLENIDNISRATKPAGLLVESGGLWYSVFQDAATSTTSTASLTL